jgi:hypothetical protein
VKILTGKRRGEVVKLHQWANDWITADTEDGRPLVLKPPMVEVEGDEYQRLTESYGRFQQGDKRTGFFWRAWALGDDGRFTRREA